MKKVLLSLLVVLTFIFVGFSLIKADTQTTVELIDGVQIRTDNLNGLKWVANIKNHDDNNIYGFLFSLGEVSNLTIENKDAINQVVEGVTTEEPIMSATMVNFPKSAATTDISVRAYVKVGNSYYYSTNTVVRNLAEVALSAYGTTEGSFVNNIVNYVDENYKSQYVGFDGLISFASAKYEVNPANLEKEFVKDWNAKFGTSWTEFNYNTFNTSAIAGNKPLTADTDKDCSGTNAYAFFKTDAVTSAKWGWLLQFFLAETATGVHPKLQMNAVISDTGTYTLLSNGKEYTDLYQFKHLSRSLYNFFKAGTEDINDYPSVGFTDSHLFAKISEYNNKIIAFSPELVKVNEEVVLPEIEKDGYVFDGYSVDESEPLKVITISSENKLIVPQYTAVQYTAKFMLGSTELKELELAYNIEEDIYLPTPIIEGYDFLGWYDNAEFTGNPIEMIETGSYGDKVFYAKTETQTYVNVNVTFDANGGSFNPTTTNIPGDFEIEVEKAVNYAADITYLAPSTTASTLRYQYKVIFNYNATLGLFEVIAVDAATKTLTEAAAGATWTHALANSAQNITTNFVVGQYVYLNTTALASGKQVAQVYNSLDSLTKYSTVMKKPETLPVPTNGLEEFAGWKSSVDGSIIKEYPGYMSNPGDITYTAQWGDIVNEEINAEVTFDYNGAISEEVYKANGTNLSSLVLSVYNDNANYATLMKENIFIYKADNVYNSNYSYRYCIAKNASTGLYEVTHFIDKLAADSTIPAGTEYVIVISTGYTGSYTSNFDRSKVAVGNVVLFDKDFTTASSSNLVTATFYSNSVSNYNVVTTVTESSVLPTPTRVDYKFGGWYDTNDNLIDSVEDLRGIPAITLVAKWNSTSNINAEVTFDYNGGITEELIKTKGSPAGSLIISNYNGNFWNLYADNTFIYPVGTSFNPQGAKRIYIAQNSYNGLYYVLGTQTSGVSAKPEGTDYIITVSDSYSGTYDDNFDVSKLAKGDIVFFNKSFTAASSTNLVTLSFYKGTIANDSITQTINSDVKFVTPVKDGYKFAGWYDANDNLYSTYKDLAGVETITLTAKYIFDDTLVGSFKDNSWVEVGSSIKLNYKFVSGSNIAVSWKSNNPSIAEVDAEGNVTGNAVGLAEIVVYAKDAPSISFTYYVTVVADGASSMLQVLLDSNNESIFIRNDLGIGAGTPAYYYDAIGSVSNLLFTTYTEHKDFYLSSPSNKSTLTGSGTGGVDFICVHYAADMPYSATYSKKGGSNLASYNKTCNTNGTGASWHYSVGNDGVWYCQNTAYGAWHAGTSKTMTWTSTGLTTAKLGTNVYTTDVTLGSDGYFYIKGIKTSVKNSTGYTRLNSLGLGVKLSGSTWYLGGHYYNSSYKYISSLGGNCNSIGMETSVREGSDLWLTWQYTAQLCAKLLIQFNLPIQRLVGHHFFSGKDCPQPLLLNENEIWHVFREMVIQQMAYFKAYGSAGAAPTLSTTSKYIDSKGRVTSLPTYSTCQTYTLSYKDGSSTKTVTLSTIIPGTIA